MRVCIDLDGTIFDFGTWFHAQAEATLGRALLSPKTWQVYDLAENMKLSPDEHSTVWKNLTGHPELYPGASSFVGALEGLGHQIVFATAGIPAIRETRERIIKDAFGLPLIFTPHKKYLNAHVLVDDSLDQHDGFNGFSLAIRRSYHPEGHNPRILICDDFAGVLSWFDAIRR